MFTNRTQTFFKEYFKIWLILGYFMVIFKRKKNDLSSMVLFYSPYLNFFAKLVRFGFRYDKTVRVLRNPDKYSSILQNLHTFNIIFCLWENWVDWNLSHYRSSTSIWHRLSWTVHCFVKNQIHKNIIYLRNKKRH